MGRYWHRLIRFLRRPGVERWLLLEAVLWLGLARVALLAVPFRRLVRSRPRPRPDAGRDGVDDAAGVRVGWAVRAASRHTPWRSDCLPQALAARRMLARRGVASTLVVGTRAAADGVVAHAWVRCGDATLTGGAEEDRYTIVATFE